MQIIRLSIILVFALLCTSCEGFFDNIKDRVPNTTMEIEDPIRHYYPVVRGDKLKVTYKFKNTGEHTLLIDDVQASCGCITTNNFKRSIAPGNFGYLEFEYDSTKNIGYVEHYVLIVANIEDTFSNEVKFATNVVSDPLYIKDYEQIYQEQQNTNAEGLVEGDSKLKYYIPKN